MKRSIKVGSIALVAALAAGALWKDAAKPAVPVKGLLGCAGDDAATPEHWTVSYAHKVEPSGKGANLPANVLELGGLLTKRCVPLDGALVTQVLVVPKTVRFSVGGHDMPRIEDRLTVGLTATGLLRGGKWEVDAADPDARRIVESMLVLVTPPVSSSRCNREAAAFGAEYEVCVDGSPTGFRKNHQNVRFSAELYPGATTASLSGDAEVSYASRGATANLQLILLAGDDPLATSRIELKMAPASAREVASTKAAQPSREPQRRQSARASQRSDAEVAKAAAVARAAKVDLRKSVSSLRHYFGVDRKSVNLAEVMQDVQDSLTARPESFYEMRRELSSADKADRWVLDVLIQSLGLVGTPECQEILVEEGTRYADQEAIAKAVFYGINEVKAPRPEVVDHVRHAVEAASIPRIRSMARLSLGILASREGLGASLVPELQERAAAAEGRKEREDFIAALGNSGAADLPTRLRSFAEGGEVSTQREVAFALRHANSDSSRALLGNLLTNADDGVRRQAVVALSYHKGSSASLDLMHKVLKDDSVESVRLAALEGVWGLRHQAAEVFQIVHEVAERDASAELRRRAREMLRL